MVERIRGETADLDRLVKRALMAWEKSRRVSSDQEIYLDSVALNLHGFYSGLERIFQLIARRVDENNPSGDLWHRDLLKQMSREQQHLRPAVISTNSFSALDELRRFRHLVRNVYAFNLLPEKVAPIVSNLSKSWPIIEAEVLAFADFLEQTE